MNEQPSSRKDSDFKDIELLFQRSDPAPIPVNIEELLGANSPAPQRRANWPIVGSIALTCLAASIVLLVNLIGSSSSSQAFAQVKERIERVRTVEFIERRFETLPDGVEGGQFPPGVKPRDLARKRVAKLEQALATASAEEKAEIESKLSLIRQMLKETKAGESLPTIGRVRIKGKTMRRKDGIFPFETESIRNAETGESVDFNRQQKSVSRFTKHIIFDQKTGKRSESAVSFDPAVDFFQAFRNVPSEAQNIGTKQFSGRLAIGYRTSSEIVSGTITRTYWIDKQTTLPVKIVNTFISSQDENYATRLEQTEFKFDAPIDEAIFGTATPEGYTEKEGAFLAIKIGEDEEDDEEEPDQQQ